MAKIKNKLEKHNRKLKINVGNNTFTMDEEEWERLNTFSKNKKMEQSLIKEYAKIPKPKITHCKDKNGNDIVYTEYLGDTIWQHKEDYDIMKQIDNEIVKQVNES